MQPETLLKEVFLTIISKETSGKRQSDFTKLLKQSHSPVKEHHKPPSHSLELNLILVFIYMAGKGFGLLEKDIL
jgi:hypothetical protein